MHVFIRSILIAATLAAIPAAAMASEKFVLPSLGNARTVVNPGLWFTLKNECSGAAYATVGDYVCLLQIDSATYLTKLHEGDVPAGYSEQFNICANSAGGDGLLGFIPLGGNAQQAVQVSVKPNSTVAIPGQFCK